MLITVVTVCYNSENYIERTLKSVLGQNYQNYEYIIIDGKSTDKTCSIISSYKEKINLFISEPDTGIYNAMNKAILKAKGEWIIFLNAGDTFVDESTLEKVSPFLIENRADVVYGDIYKKRKSGELLLKRAEKQGNKHRMYFCHQAVFCRTSLLKKYQFDEKYRLSADFKFFKQIFIDGYRFCQINMPISVFDTTGISNTNRNAGLMENINVIKELDNVFTKIKLLPRLYFVVFWNNLRKKKH